jgi:hypothetical protein
MIKKLLLLILIISLFIGTFSVITGGIETEFLTVPSFMKFSENNKILDEKIAEIELLKEEDYSDAIRKLDSAKSRYESAKKAYDSLALQASEKDIAEANRKEEFLLDFLWIKIGNYANDNNIKVKFDPKKGTPEIKFDVSGAYISVINFIYDIENDRDLSFNVDNIIVEGGSSDTVVKATFTVGGVNVITAAE